MNERTQRPPNVGAAERWLTGLAGSAMAAYGLARGGRTGGVLVLAGGGLLLRAATAHCPAYGVLGLSSAASTDTRDALRGGRGLIVQRHITIHRPVGEVYSFWRNLEHLPRFMRYLESVHQLDGARSHWVAVAPTGTRVEWDAEIIHEEPNKVIGWRSLEGADVPNAGSVNFRELADNATEVRVRLQYAPPAGRLGFSLAKLLGKDPSHTIGEDLKRLKAILEAA